MTPAYDVTPAASEETEALARSVLLESLAVGFQLPTRDSLERIESAGARHILTLAADTLDPTGASGLLHAVSRFSETKREDAGDRVVRYGQLFGHTARGPVCPYETEYGAEALFRQPQELAHIAGYYAAFGLKPRGEAGERVDHVSCECEFVAFLSRKEAFLLAEGREVASETSRVETLETTCRAQRSFLEDHLGRFGTAFGLRLSQQDAGGFYGTMAEVLSKLLCLESERLGVVLGPPTLDLRSTEEEEVPVSCGSGEQLVQIQTRRNAGRRPEA